MSDKKDKAKEDEGAEVIEADFSKSKLRALTVGKRSKADPRTVECEIEGETVAFDVYPLTYGERKKVHQKATKTGYDEQGNTSVEFDQTTYELELLVRCTHVPGSDERVFERGDIEDLMNQHIGPGHWMTTLISAAQEMNRAKGN